MVVFPPYRLDTDQERLWKGDASVSIRRKPFAILRYLAAHPKKLVTHEELLAQVWGGAVVSESAVRSHLHELRQVVGDGVVETVVGRGYRFIAEIDAGAVERPPPEIASRDPLVVGRDGELAALGAAFERACAGRRQICFVVGEPGIGKSTLVRTFLAGLDTRAVIVGRGACFEQHGTPEPYLAIIEALGELARSRCGPQAISALVRYAPTFVSQVPNLVGGDQLADVTRRAIGGTESRLLRELSEAIEAMCTQDPLVLVLEDLQWSDVATIDLLSLLGQRQERAKLLVIGTTRHAEVQGASHPLKHAMRSLVARSGATSVNLTKIDLAAVQDFVDRRFADHAFPPRLTEVVARITSGIPLFVVSLLDELANREIVAKRADTWTLVVGIDEVEAHRPDSVKQLIDIQLDRLPSAEQRVLEAASVVGAEFSTALVAAALETHVDEIDDTCDSLVRRSLFLRVEPDGRYGVTHALVQEVCLERSSPSRRQRWHRLIAESLRPRATECSHVLAKHFEGAKDAVRAVPAYLAAARHAGARFAASDATALCSRAYDLLPQLPASRDRDLLEFQILQTMCQQVSSNLFSAAFAGREPLTVYARAIEIARSLDDASSLYAALTQLCNYYLIIAQYRRTPELTSELEQLERDHAIEAGLLHAGIFARAYIAFFRADFETALRLLERLTPPAGVESVFQGNLFGRAVALGHLACVRWVIGDPDRALDESVATIELAMQSKHPVLIALGHVVRGRLRYLRRDPLSIVDQETPEAVRASAADLGLHFEARAFALWAEARRSPLAMSAIQPLLEDFHVRLTAVSTCSTLVAQVLIDVLRRSGHHAQARDITELIIAFAIAHDERVYLPELLRLRGEQREGTDRAAAATDYREAIALAVSTGARSLEARATASLAALETSPPHS